MSETDRPEIPEPEKLPSDDPTTAEAPSPSMNGNGAAHVPAGAGIDIEKLVQWMKHTDKQITLLLVGQVALGCAVMFLLYKGKGDVVKTVSP